ncbi:MAG: pyridoxal 5'-phosphate synthase glutaminase subunit PdxT [Chloroflexi bacterium]|nr:pyridoxal 5'-phosphate synthase glutaminase subunit PdxT [Chloroflexota bacterium]HOG77866.1 pyridoxal 5'-phosphate synthase glutaminase subunit PdxT [Anaerolineaceae bacterium]
MKIGVLALQGDFVEHRHSLSSLAVDSVEVRLPAQLEGLDGLIIPGGESTTIGKLMVAYQLLEPLRAFAREKAIWGTCAGAILLSQDAGRDQDLLKVMDIQITRNAFGRQLDSFETELRAPFLNPAEPPYHAVFIRAPIITQVFGRAETLIALEDGRVVAARQGKLLATSFHPELTPDMRFHRYFLELARSPHAE